METTVASKNRGKAFEDVVKKSFDAVNGVSIDRLRDAAKKMKNVDNPSDFIVYKYPHEIYVECKSHKGNTLPFNCIRSQQMVQMMKKSYINGVKAGFIIWYIEKDITVWIDVRDVFSYWFNIGEKSINIKDIEKMNGIIIQGKKKRVYFDYDMEDFLRRLYD